MLYLGSAAWMLGMAVLGDRPRVRDHALTLGVGLGALLAGLLIAVPAAGTAGATTLASPGDRSTMRAFLAGQSAWLATAVFLLAGYALSRLGRRIRSPRALALEVIVIGGAAALVPAASHHLGAMAVLVPLAAAGVAASLLEDVPRPLAVLAGLLATGAFALLFTLAHAAEGPAALAALLAGVVAGAYAVGRWSDLHPAAASRPSKLTFVGLAAGFLLAYRL